METQCDLVEEEEGNSRQAMEVDGARVCSSSNSAEVGLSLDMRPTLPALQIPCQPDVVAKPSASSSLLPPLPTTKSGKFSGSHGQLPRSGLRSRASIEKNLNIYLTGTQRGSSESVQPTLSGLPLLPLWNKRTSSLPVRTNALTSGIDPDFNKGHSHDLGHLNSESGNGKVNIVRSFSTPVFVNKIESFRRNGSERKGYVLLRSVNPRIHRLQPSRENESVNHEISALLDAEKGKGDTEEDVEEAIPEDEAVCRICMDSLTEDYGETLKMECLCLGEMALAHKECAFKWFGIKGDRVCDVCGSVVSNIPVTVVPFVVKETSSHSLSMEAQTVPRPSVWQDVLFMGTISTMAHFCFIEQLLVYKLGTKALPISISFAFVIGFLAAVTTVALVSRRYIWLYAFVQFALLCFFGYIFFVKTELEAMPAILLAAFVSFGIAMTSNALILEFVHWRAGSVQSANSTMDVEASLRRETNGDIESEPANSRSPNSRRAAASDDQFLHES